MEITGGWEQVVVTDKKEKPSEQVSQYHFYIIHFM